MNRATTITVYVIQSGIGTDECTDSKRVYICVSVQCKQQTHSCTRHSSISIVECFSNAEYFTNNILLHTYLKNLHEGIIGNGKNGEVSKITE